MIKIFFNNAENAESAFRTRKYDMAIILGNRVLSDVSILKEELPEDQYLLCSLLGFFIRRAGIDLLFLSNIKKDTAKLRQATLNFLGKWLKSPNGPVRELFNEYFLYLEQYSIEINSNDVTNYSRNGELNGAIFKWSMKELKKINKSSLEFGDPVRGVNQELRRMSYVEKLSQVNILLQFCMETLEWYSELSKKIVSNYKAQIPAISSEAIESIEKIFDDWLSFIQNVYIFFDSYEKKGSEEFDEKELKKFLNVTASILISWRKNLNLYYNLQTIQPPAERISEPEKEKEESV